MLPDSNPTNTWAIEANDGVNAVSRPASQSGSLSRPARRDPIRGGGLRRRPTRIMRDIISALKESVQALAQEELEATGNRCDPCTCLSNDRPADLEKIPSRYDPPKPKDCLTQRFSSTQPTAHADGRYAATRPTRIKLLRSQDLCCEEPINTELKCDYCSRAFCLQDGGASFDGKAACVNCEQLLNRNVVLPAISQLRPQLRHECKTAPTSQNTKRSTTAPE